MLITHARRRLAARLRAARDNDRGSVPANTVVAAATMGLFFLVVQVSLIYTGHQTARGAARHAVDAARLETGTAEEGEALAEQFLTQTGALQDPEVTVTRTADTVTVTVTGSAWSPTSLLDPPITVTATAPVERVIG